MKLVAGAIGALVGVASTAQAQTADVSFLGPAGVLAEGRHALFTSADTELPGYPAVEVGYRYGGLGVADIGVEIQAIDVAALGRVHGKVRLYEDPARRGFLGLRLRVDFKRQVQPVDPDTFRDIDDFGFVFAPELSAGVRLDPRREHAIHYFTYAYLDFDVRPAEPRFQWYYAPAVIGYEWHHPAGFHLFADSGIGWEVGDPETFGELIPRLRLSVGWEI